MGMRYEAIFSPSRRQVNLNGQWMNPSPAAMAITVYPANGWIFWKYKQWRRFRTLARQQGSTAAYLLKEAIEEYLQKSER
jgi:hypothetical protein